MKALPPRVGPCSTQPLREPAEENLQTRQDTTRQDTTRQDTTRQDTTRQDTTRQDRRSAQAQSPYKLPSNAGHKPCQIHTGTHLLAGYHGVRQAVVVAPRVLLVNQISDVKVLDLRARNGTHIALYISSTRERGAEVSRITSHIKVPDLWSAGKRAAERQRGLLPMSIATGPRHPPPSACHTSQHPPAA